MQDMKFRFVEPNDERASKCSEESRRAQIARESAMTDEQREIAVRRMQELIELMRNPFSKPLLRE
jgi:hypothetical protein